MVDFIGTMDQSVVSGITAVATVVIALFAAVTSILTYVLAVENRRLRKAGTEPEVIAYLAPHPDGNGAINFVLANIGRGPAHNLKFELICDEEDFKQHEVMLYNDPKRSALTILPQEQKFSSLFGIGYVLAGGRKDRKGAVLKPFEVRITYQDTRGRQRSSTYQIDISQFFGLAGIFAKPDSRRVADSLDNIERHLSKIAGQSNALASLVDTTAVDDVYRK